MTNLFLKKMKANSAKDVKAYYKDCGRECATNCSSGCSSCSDACSIGCTDRVKFDPQW